MGSLRLVVAEDRALAREGLRRWLEEQSGWAVVADVDNGHAAIEAAADLAPDVAVLDTRLSRLNGIDATRAIARRSPRVRVLLLGLPADEATVTRAVRAGARGALHRDDGVPVLIQAVSTIAGGAAFFSPVLAQLILNSVARAGFADAPDPYESLSDRERQVLQLVAEGFGNKEIAAALDISVSTVETHRARVQQKLNVHNAAGLVLFAVRRGLLG